MPFQKGNKLGRGGRCSNPGGRPSKKDQQKKKEAAQTARDMLEAEVTPITETYLKLTPAFFFGSLRIEPKSETVSLFEGCLEAERGRLGMSCSEAARFPSKEKPRKFPAIDFHEDFFSCSGSNPGGLTFQLP